MIPFNDDNPTRTFPHITIGLIVLNSLVFLIEIMYPGGMKYILFNFGAIPKNLLSFGGDQPISPPLTVLTSMFLHGGFLHIGGNMLYLWIFGNNIEDRLGHFRFLVFYLISGIVAAYAYALSSPGSRIPMVGASGAIAGILGAYLLLYPRAKVHTLVFFGFFVTIIKIPAFFVIGFWGLIQVINGLLSKGLMARGGIAWFAHVGGFLFGLLTIRLWLPKSRWRE
ncbi:rhomboid protease GluP [bacterium BMS3Bbin06]|nr:rhomboid protease GluP [bacterium BMS3Abin08]GBE35821.1 rhomboid protease GluP [bacterium BMS3Bbin06]HDH00465.1 rhomboid family intramembrane serine protease [Nitrospirota bacterium]HDO25494.1 rhomboid family intramembrane serine protease [Nitrospirota bacterium]HDO35497.1 rhomboid family intramembrane serine protease [Nitrospirota bacterium]